MELEPFAMNNGSTVLCDQIWFHATNTLACRHINFLSNLNQKLKVTVLKLTVTALPICDRILENRPFRHNN